MMKLRSSATLTGYRLLVILLAFAATALGAPRSASASVAVPIVVITCPTCQNPTDLLGTATTYFLDWDGLTPPGYVGIMTDWGDCSGVSSSTSGPTVLLVVSTAIAISSTYYACYIYPKGGPVLRVYPISGSTWSNAINQDNHLFARAAVDAGRIVLPSNLPYNQTFGPGGGNVTEEMLDQSVSSLITLTGDLEWAPWHNIANALNTLKGNFINDETGQQFEAFTSDTVTVTDANGWTAKFEFMGTGTPYMWMIVPGSIRDAQGHPQGVSGPAPSTSGSVEPIGTIDISLPSSWGTMELWTEPWYDDSTPEGHITVGPLGPTYPPGGTQCGTTQDTNDYCN